MEFGEKIALSLDWHIYCSPENSENFLPPSKSGPDYSVAP
jgi:hypothetical protein